MLSVVIIKHISCSQDRACSSTQLWWNDHAIHNTHWNSHFIVLVDVTQTDTKVLWWKYPHPRDTGSVTPRHCECRPPTDYTNTSQQQCHNCISGITATEKFMQWYARTGTMLIQVPRTTSWWVCDTDTCACRFPTDGMDRSQCWCRNCSCEASCGEACMLSFWNFILRWLPFFHLVLH